MAADITKHLYVYCWVSFCVLFMFIKLAKSDNYIVHMDISAMPKAFSNQHTWYLATLSSVSAKSKAETNPTTPFSKLIYTYNHVIQGFSASLTPAELESLKNSPGYVSSVKDRVVKVDTTHSFEFLDLNSGTGAWPVSSFGKDVIVGVIDTGVWPESESFNDDGMSDVPSRWKGECESGTQFNSSLCNKKLIGARFFNKGLIAHNSNITISMNSTRDTEGHGTHTSTTVAGTYVKDASYFGYAPGTARGMAPMARVAMYKALWEEGAYTTDIIAAIDQAITDGVDVLSMSLGLDGVDLYEDPIAIATFAAIEKNIFVSTSAGNEGPDVETLHNGTPWVITVAAGTMDRDFGATLILSNKVSINGLAQYPGNFTSTEFPIVFMDTCSNKTELSKIKQKIIVCQDPGKEDSLDDQFNNILAAGNIAAVFITNSSSVDVFVQSPFPAIFLVQKDGDTVVDFIKSNTDPKASIVFKKTILGIKPSPRVTSYTSRGPSYSCPLVLKPDIMAPGDSVLAAWPPNIAAARVNQDLVFTNFNLLSGTSMACPHVSGIAALLKAVYPNWSPAAIRSALMTTSDQIDNTGSPIKDIGGNLRPADPLAMGAGHVNPNKALNPGLIYDATVQDYVDLLCGLNFTQQQIKTITKTSSNNCSNPSLDLNYPSFIAFFNDRGAKPNSTTVVEFGRTVTNVGDGSFTYKANVTPINGLKVTVEPDTLVFKTKYEKKSYKLSIEGPKQLHKAVLFGYLTWEDSGKEHVVTSPIVATSYKIEK
ncbi:hypothetical protein ERO13_D06G018600v2 [Gossypium hirsutum]|uniref:Subtilisin-like protease SBT3 n=3 Tax=Gossypium TaxID=3633 RepID=A0A1U8MSB0_GOSHI|nr:subtilisin-like protease SBT3 [Gossypium hirsutum]KAB2023474.1 hypothetical protein ES319_D06G021200v1 [Gossypium barbadense]KAG4140437.1 hypothetical protein ERO13_D06G018600v2 [Gossypium hirsutum]TYG63355.1 hypothetical protein ES288_D06G022900v1 [Gossypium darwinii]